MKNKFNLSSQSVNTQANALGEMLNGGKLRMYSGKQPKSADAKAEGTLLVSLSFSGVAFSPAVSGVIRSKSVDKGIAVATGKASWFRCVQSNGRSVMDGSIGPPTSGADLSLNIIDIQKNAEVSISSFKHKVNR